MQEPRWLTTAEQRAWVGLMATSTLLDAALDDRTREAAGISHASYAILAMLAARPNGSAHMQDLAMVTGQSQSRLSHAVARLETDGLVTRARCPDNARFVDATLTDRGRGLLERAAPAHVADVRRLVVDRLNADQVAQLSDITATLLDGLREAGYPTPDVRHLGEEAPGDA